MDHSIERRHVVYASAQGALNTCPANQCPRWANVVYSGTQMQCERYIRNAERNHSLNAGRKPA